MRQTVAKKLKRLVRAQFGTQGNVKENVLEKIYNRLKVGWNKTPKNQRYDFSTWLGQSNNLYRAVNKK